MGTNVLKRVEFKVQLVRNFKGVYQLTISFLPKDEESRLQALHYLLIDDAAAENRYGSEREYIAEFLEVSVELVNLVDAELKGLKCIDGLDTAEPRQCLSFCCNDSLENEPVIVNDVLVEPCCENNLLEINERKICFITCLPIIKTQGARIGTLCIKGHEPRQLKEWELEHLHDIAKVVARDHE